MLTQVQFRSSIFRPYEGEEMPSILAGSASGWRSSLRGLRQKGFEAGEPVAEDWGWVVPIKNKDFAMWIGCGNSEDHDDGFLCFIEPHTPTIRKSSKIDVSDRVAALRQAIDQLLSAEPGVARQELVDARGVQ